MATDAQKKARNAYNTRSTKAITVRFYPTDMELHDHVAAQPNKAAYIKRLIREGIDAEHGAAYEAERLKRLEGQETDLKPCPFCGHPAEAREIAYKDGTTDWMVACFNPECHLGGIEGGNLADMVEKWNRRA